MQIDHKYTQIRAETARVGCRNANLVPTPSLTRTLTDGVEMKRKAPLCSYTE